MSEPRPTVNLASPGASLDAGQVPAPPPVARFFGVPFLKGAAREVSAIHLCPAVIHLATIRDGWDLEVANRRTLTQIELGDLRVARHVAFRPRLPGSQALELAIVGPLDKPEIARMDLGTGDLLPGLPLAEVTALQYSFDGRFLCAGNREGRVRVWLLAPEGPLRVQEADLGAQVESLTFHPEHPTVYAVLATGALAEVRLAPSPAPPVEPALRERAPGALFHRVTAGPSGYPIYLAGWDERVYVVDTATSEVGAFSPRVGPIHDLQVLPAGGSLCVAGPHAIYLLRAVGPLQREHNALLCEFQERIYAVRELDREAVLVFHSVEEGAS